MRRGFLDLVAAMDWFSRRILAWRLSNIEPCHATGARTMARGRRLLHRGAAGGGGAVRATGGLQHRPGPPVHEPRFIEVLARADIRISINGRGRWLDNMFIERLWRALKYACISLQAFETGL